MLPHQSKTTPVDVQKVGIKEGLRADVVLAAGTKSKGLLESCPVGPAHFARRAGSPAKISLFRFVSDLQTWEQENMPRKGLWWRRCWSVRRTRRNVVQVFVPEAARLPHMHKVHNFSVLRPR